MARGVYRVVGVSRAALGEGQPRPSVYDPASDRVGTRLWTDPSGASARFEALSIGDVSCVERAAVTQGTLGCRGLPG